MYALLDDKLDKSKRPTEKLKSFYRKKSQIKSLKVQINFQNYSYLLKYSKFPKYLKTFD